MTNIYLEGLTPHQLITVRIVALTVAAVSVLAGLVFLYCFLLIHPQRRTFRHSLVAFLIFFDFTKSIAILVFSAMTLAKDTLHNSLIQGLGWLTVFSIEGADVIIFSFALHMALLIFNNSTISTTGGLYKHRYIVYITSFLFPILLASISFCVHDTYQEFVYMPFFRVWTGAWWFSWSVRHVITVGIIVIYISIYIYVMVQFKNVSKSFKKEENDSDEEFDELDDDFDKSVMKSTFGESLWYKALMFLAMLVFPDISISAKLHGQSLTTATDLANIEKLKNESTLQTLQPSNEQISKQIQKVLNEEAMHRFNTRKMQILKQMKIIFIYPISFFLLWLFPFINHYQVIRNHYETMWSTAPASAFQPMNCFIDVLVFLIREKPWQLTQKIDTCTNLPFNDTENWRSHISWLPGFANYGKQQTPSAPAPDTVPKIINIPNINYDSDTDIDIHEFLNSPPL